ncbi:MAG TPA: hypothetical protein VI357_14290 [Mycobacteriales bacterium]
MADAAGRPVTHVLVHGGLWEDMDAERFWVRPCFGEVCGIGR